MVSLHPLLILITVYINKLGGGFVCYDRTSKIILIDEEKYFQSSKQQQYDTDSDKEDSDDKNCCARFEEDCEHSEWIGFYSNICSAIVALILLIWFLLYNPPEW